MTQLIKYEAARHALTQAVMFDEVMAIMGAAEQAALYAKQANDNELVEKATEIRVRAQRRAGEMLTKAKEQGFMADQSTGGSSGAAAKHGRSLPTTSQPPTLKQIGVTKDQSAHWQKLAAMPEEHFEAAVETAKAATGQVATAFMLREATGRARPHKKLSGADKRRLDQLEQAKGNSMLIGYSRMVLKALLENESFSDVEREVLGTLKAEIERALALH